MFVSCSRAFISFGEFFFNGFVYYFTFSRFFLSWGRRHATMLPRRVTLTFSSICTTTWREWCLLQSYPTYVSQETRSFFGHVHLLLTCHIFWALSSLSQLPPSPTLSLPPPSPLPFSPSLSGRCSSYKANSSPLCCSRKQSGSCGVAARQSVPSAHKMSQNSGS